MADDLEETGPIDYLVIQFSVERATGEGMPILLDLVDRGIIRVLDMVFLRKNADGLVARLSMADLDELGFHALAAFDGAASGLVGDDDVEEAGALLEPGSVAGIVVYENSWAARFGAALRRGGAQLLAGGRIPVQAILAALDAAESKG